jgi:hypothetical protein
MKLVYTVFFGSSLSGSNNMHFLLLLFGKTNREQRCSLSSIINNLTFPAFCNINVSGDNRLRKIKVEVFRGIKMQGVWCRKTRDIIKPFLRPNIHIPYFGG